MAATPSEWANAYLSQARVDLAAAALLAEHRGPRSVLAMLLQMVFEKLAKAALLRQGAVHVSWATTSHAAARGLVRALRVQRPLLQPIGGREAWRSALDLVDELERAHPQLAADGAPRLEYPWEDSSSLVRWPEQHLPLLRHLEPTSTRGAQLLKFARMLEQRFDQVFPPRETSVS